MNKPIDCVDMKHKAQEKIRAELQGKTREQELAYWNEQTRRLNPPKTTEPVKLKKSA